MLGDKISLIASRLVNVIIRFLQMRFPVRLHIECAECNWEASCDGSCFPFSS
jgi:radical SAM protein with 4Fe4S-binding SPASM domain